MSTSEAKGRAPSEESRELALDVVCGRLQWSRETPSAFVIAWANSIAFVFDRIWEEAIDSAAKVIENEIALREQFDSHMRPISELAAEIRVLRSSAHEAD